MQNVQSRFFGQGKIEDTTEATASDFSDQWRTHQTVIDQISTP